ncbi:MAG TPA: sigma-70 family RNA polymerase sigma factor [Ktedonobacterales bacterium]|nr:sigma-70 family RNA polymerase sigma factor [Ktedonobacterales bacterium]
MEDQCLRAARQGDPAAFRELIELHAQAVWRVVHILIPDKTLAEDAVQETWLDIWRGLPQFDVSRPFRPWLLTIAANRCRKSLRRRALPIIALDSPEALNLADEQDVAADLVRRETSAELTALLAALPQEQRRLLQLRYYAALDLPEIALVLNVPLGTVKSRLHRAIQVVRTRLEEHLNLYPVE